MRISVVQETPNTAFSQYGWWFDAVTFRPMFEPNAQGAPAPTLDLRFSKLYLPPNDYHLWSGLNEFPYYDYYDSEASVASVIYWQMRDCEVQGGRINLGEPDYFYYPVNYVYGPGAVSWFNNSFDNVAINLDPTYYPWGWNNQGLNCDMQVKACNNLFRGGYWFVVQSIPASAGNWAFMDNLFDKVDFIQDVSDAGLPLDFGHNGIRPGRSGIFI
jgi:hypothetical protein